MSSFDFFSFILRLAFASSRSTCASLWTSSISWFFCSIIKSISWFLSSNTPPSSSSCEWSISVSFSSERRLFLSEKNSCSCWLQCRHRMGFENLWRLPLHTKINRNQKWTCSTLTLSETGRATYSFTLHMPVYFCFLENIVGYVYCFTTKCQLHHVHPRIELRTIFDLQYFTLASFDIYICLHLPWNENSIMDFKALQIGGKHQIEILQIEYQWTARHFRKQVTLHIKSWRIL